MLCPLPLLELQAAQSQRSPLETSHSRRSNSVSPPRPPTCSQAHITSPLTILPVNSILLTPAAVGSRQTAPLAPSPPRPWPPATPVLLEATAPEASPRPRRARAKPSARPAPECPRRARPARLRRTREPWPAKTAASAWGCRTCSVLVRALGTRL